MKRKSKECKKISPFLKKYLNGELSSDMKAKVDAHIISCKRCKNEIEAYDSVNKTVELMRLSSHERYNSTQPPVNLEQEIFRNIETLNVHPDSFMFNNYIKVACVAMVVILILVIPLKFIWHEKRNTYTSYGYNNFIADVISQAKAAKNAEKVKSVTSEIMGVTR